MISLSGQFLGLGVARLDDPFDRPELAAHDAPELGRVGREDTGQGDRGVVLAARLEDRVEIRAGHERHVTGQHEDLGRLVRDDRERRAHRVTGPARLILESEDRAIGEDIDERGDGRREDHDRAATGGAVLGARPGVEDVGQHRSTAQQVEDLGRPGPHPCAETGRQHDGGRAGSVGHAGVGLGTWGVHEGWRRWATVVGRLSRPGPSRPGAKRSAVISGSAHRRGGPSGVSTDPRDDLDLDPRSLRQGGDTDRRARRRRIGHEPTVDAVDDREVGHIDEEDRRLDHVAPRRPRRIEDARTGWP